MSLSENFELPWEWLHRPLAQKPLASTEGLLGMTTFYLILISVLSYLMKDKRAQEASILEKEAQLKKLKEGEQQHTELLEKIKEEKAKFKPIDISFLTIPHNLIMCLYSLYAFIGVSLVLWQNLVKNNYALSGLWCDPNKDYIDGLEYWAYNFYLSKFVEYVDTVFLLLKCKPMMPPGNSQYFLHVYHHAVTAAIVWSTIQWRISTGWSGPFTNSFVHILMYGYYFLAELKAVDRNLGGKFITPIQLVQFVFCVVSVVIEVLLGTCKSDTTAVPFLIGNYVIFFMFFAKIFWDKKMARVSSRTQKKEQ